MNTGLLKTFLTVARCLHFSKAAEELLLTQPAVSRQIRQLESDLGVVLFERLGRSVLLTDAGRELCSLGESLLGQIDRVREAVRGFGNAERGLLRIGASTTPGYYILPRILGCFRRAHPGVELRFTVENSLTIERRILYNDLDLGFIGTHPAGAVLRAESMAKDEIVCFGPADHPLANRKRVPPTALVKETWLVREEGSATRVAFEKWLRDAGAALRHTIELRSPEAIKAMVREGVGISFMSIMGVQEELHRGQLKQINISGSRLTRAIYLVRHPDKHISPTIREFLALLRSSVPKGDCGRV